MNVKKIPTIYVRDDSGHITRDWTPGCDWVFLGIGRPTRKYDGTACLLDESGWWSRRMVREGNETPANFRPVYVTPTTPTKTFGWIPMGDSQFTKLHAEAMKSVHGYDLLAHGTYELIGPKINGNPENEPVHRLQLHDAAETIKLPAKLSFESLHDFFLQELAMDEIEGVVWHDKANNRMAKLKVSDFRALEEI